ncbi:MAG TPA: FAD-dependent oxidoreductase [Acidimicrobiales bacterium]|nr:FAD-dependent oxidoreductase [Acidimicrobiales bacterium]
MSTMEENLYDYEADVLVVGSGAAGFSAAISATLSGASVILFEGNQHVGGTTGLSGGTAWVPNNSSMRDQGVTDPKDHALEYLARLAAPQYFSSGQPTLGLPQHEFDLLSTFYDEGADVIDALTEVGALDLVAEVNDTDHYIQFPDYGGHLPENRAPRGRHLAPRPKSGFMIQQLERGATTQGVTVLLEHRVHDTILNEDGDVVGLEIRAGHRTVLAAARHGVVFASGGFGQNGELLRRHIPGRVFGSCATPHAQGDFLRIANRLGASFGQMSGAWWKQVVVEPALRSPSPPSLWMPFGDSMIQVDRTGRRAVNEKAPYHDRGQVHLHYSASSRDFPNTLLFMIWDQVVADSPLNVPFRPPVPLPNEQIDYVIEASDFGTLSQALDQRLAQLGDAIGGIRLSEDFEQNLHGTVDRFNSFAEEGIDHDFQRGSTMMELAWNLMEREGSPNQTMAPLSSNGPYYASIVGAGVLDTNGGPLINTDAQILGFDLQPIAGLYGAGNCVATPAGAAYWGPGTTIGLALTYGFIAGRNAAREPRKHLTS